MRLKKIVQIFFYCFLFAENAAIADDGRGYSDCKAFKSGLVEINEENAPHSAMKFEYNFRAKNPNLHPKYIQRKVFLDGNECQAGCKGEVHFKNESGHEEKVQIKAYIAFYVLSSFSRKVEDRDKELTPNESRNFHKMSPQSYYTGDDIFFLSQDEKDIIKLTDIFIHKNDFKSYSYEKDFLYTQMKKLSVDDVHKEDIITSRTGNKTFLRCLTLTNSPPKYPPLLRPDLPRAYLFGSVKIPITE